VPVSGHERDRGKDCRGHHRLGVNDPCLALNARLLRCIRDLLRAAVHVALTARRSPGGVVWIAAVLTLIGATLVSGAWNGLHDLDGRGVAAGIASAIFFGIYLLSAEAAGRRGAHPATVLAGGFLIASVAWAVILPWWSWPVDRLAEPEILLRVLGVGLLDTLIPFLLVVNALRLLSAAVAGIAATTEPVFAASLAWVVLGQSLAPAQLLGGGLVVGGVVLAQLARR